MKDLHLPNGRIIFDAKQSHSFTNAKIEIEEESFGTPTPQDKDRTPYFDQFNAWFRLFCSHVPAILQDMRVQDPSSASEQWRRYKDDSNLELKISNTLFTLKCSVALNDSDVRDTDYDQDLPRFHLSIIHVRPNYRGTGVLSRLGAIMLRVWCIEHGWPFVVPQAVPATVYVFETLVRSDAFCGMLKDTEPELMGLFNNTFKRICIVSTTTTTMAGKKRPRSEVEQQQQPTGPPSASSELTNKRAKQQLEQCLDFEAMVLALAKAELTFFHASRELSIAPHKHKLFVFTHLSNAWAGVDHPRVSAILLASSGFETLLRKFPQLLLCIYQRHIAKQKHPRLQRAVRCLLSQDTLFFNAAAPRCCLTRPLCVHLALKLCGYFLDPQTAVLPTWLTVFHYDLSLPQAQYLAWNANTASAPSAQETKKLLCTMPLFNFLDFYTANAGDTQDRVPNLQAESPLWRQFMTQNVKNSRAFTDMELAFRKNTALFTRKATALTEKDMQYFVEDKEPLSSKYLSKLVSTKTALGPKDPLACILEDWWYVLATAFNRGRKHVIINDVRELVHDRKQPQQGAFWQTFWQLAARAVSVHTSEYDCVELVLWYVIADMRVDEAKCAKAYAQALSHNAPLTSRRYCEELRARIQCLPRLAPPDTEA